MSALALPGSARSAQRRLLRGLGLLLAALLLGAASARVATSSHYGKAALEALIGAPVLLYIFRRPAAAMLALLAVVSSLVAYGTLPRVNLPGHPPLNAGDVVLIAAVGGTLWRRAWRHWPPIVRGYVYALVIFIALSDVATVKTMMLGHGPFRDAEYDVRNWLYLAVALPVGLEIRGALWRKFLDGAIVLAGLVSVFAILAQASPSVQHFIQNLSPVSVYSSSSVAAAGGVNVGDIARIRVQGLFFIYAMVIPTLVLVLTGRDRRAIRTFALFLMLGAVGASLNRNMYGGLVVGLLVTGTLAGSRVRFRMALSVLALVLAIAVVVFTSITPAFTAQIGRRASTVLSPSQVLQSNSAKDRAYELTFAIPSIARHPWFGVGPRQGYGALKSPFADNPRFYVQNLYLWLATDYGIPTAIAFLLVPGVCLWFGISRVMKARDPRDRTLLAAGIGTLVAMMLSSGVDTFLQDPSSTAAFGLACGLILAAGLRTYENKDVRATDAGTIRGA
jgi:hypothetical protein